MVVNKTDEEGKKQLEPQQYRVLRKKATEPAFTGKYLTTRRREFTFVELAAPNSSHPIQSTILGPAGPASGPHWPRTTSWKFLTALSEWNGLRSFARTAAVI